MRAGIFGVYGFADTIDALAGLVDLRAASLCAIGFLPPDRRGAARVRHLPRHPASSLPR